jgi:hypothetical protein
LNSIDNSDIIHHQYNNNNSDTEMFKKLRSQVQEVVNKNLGPLSPGSESNYDTTSNASRSRADSFSSVTSDSIVPIFGNYSSPARTFYPPSDIESDADYNETSFGGDNTIDSSARPSSNNSGEVTKLHKLLDIYKNKYKQLKSAYDESEAEKEKIKVN